MNWRILKIDWYSIGLLAHRARKIVRDSFGGCIPLKLYWMLERRRYQDIIDGFTIRP